jgi:hypothetical protein
VPLVPRQVARSSNPKNHHEPSEAVPRSSRPFRDERAARVPQVPRTWGPGIPQTPSTHGHPERNRGTCICFSPSPYIAPRRGSSMIVLSEGTEAFRPLNSQHSTIRPSGPGPRYSLPQQNTANGLTAWDTRLVRRRGFNVVYDHNLHWRLRRH